jgi:hypothetical protein
MVKYSDNEIEDQLLEEYYRGIKDGVESVEFRLKNKSCLNCKHAFITSDWSVGVGEHIEECNSPIVSNYRFEELYEFWEEEFKDVLDSKFIDFEDYLPKYCGNFELDFEKLKDNC